MRIIFPQGGLAVIGDTVIPFSPGTRESFGRWRAHGPEPNYFFIYIKEKRKERTINRTLSFERDNFILFFFF